MTNFSRITKISLLIFGCWFWLRPPGRRSVRQPPKKIAQAYGIDSFEQIDAVRSTFNIDFPGLKVAQSWIWEPESRPGHL